MSTNMSIDNKIKYFTPNEISLHVTEDDLWVSLFGRVFDLSPLCNDKDFDEIFALLAFAGKDISHLFDEDEEVKLHIDPDTNKVNTFLPFKRFVGASSQEESEKLYLKRQARDEKLSEAVMRKYNSQRLNLEYEPLEDDKEVNSASPPWWKDDKYVVGFLTKKTRKIKIMNTMIMRDVMIEVCSEETIEDILESYLNFNCHARSYTWKYLGAPLNMKQTLEMNGIPDIDEKVESFRLNSDDFIPTITLYFNHDLTEM